MPNAPVGHHISRGCVMIYICAVLSIVFYDIEKVYRRAGDICGVAQNVDDFIGYPFLFETRVDWCALKTQKSEAGSPSNRVTASLKGCAQNPISGAFRVLANIRVNQVFPLFGYPKTVTDIPKQ